MGFTTTGFQPKGTKTVVNITAFKVLMAAMAVRARSKSELHEITGLTNTTISRWMRVLSTGKDRIIYVESWQRKGTRGCWTAMWKMGHGMPDAPRPKALTQSEYAKRWRKNLATAATTRITLTETGLIHAPRSISHSPSSAKSGAAKVRRTNST